MPLPRCLREKRSRQEASGCPGDEVNFLGIVNEEVDAMVGAETSGELQRHACSPKFCACRGREGGSLY